MKPTFEMETIENACQKKFRGTVLEHVDLFSSSSELFVWLFVCFGLPINIQPLKDGGCVKPHWCCYNW